MDKMFYHNRQGSVEDVRCSVKRATNINDLKASLADELAKQNRSSVIKMIEVKVKKLNNDNSSKNKH